jgi:hypothetical protein
MSPTRSDSLRKHLVQSHIQPALSPLGFSFNGTVFISTGGDIVRSIGFPIRSPRGLTTSYLAAAVGVGSKQLARFLEAAPKGLPLGDLDPLAPVSIGTNIGRLVPPYHFREWEISPESQIEAVAADILSSFKEAAASFFSRLPDVGSFISYWESKGPSNNSDEGIVYLSASILYLMNQRDRALALVEAYLNTVANDHSHRINRTSAMQARTFLQWLRLQQPPGDP